MTRKKTAPEKVRAKVELSARLRAARVALFGEHGGPVLARRLGLPVRTWYNYEVGVTVPAHVLLQFMEETRVEPRWLLHGEGPMVRDEAPPVAEGRPPTNEGLLSGLLRCIERGQVRISWEISEPSPPAEPDASSLPSTRRGSFRFGKS